MPPCYSEIMPPVTRSWLNNGLIRDFTSRSEAAQSSSVVSIEALDIHDLPNHGRSSIQRPDQNATVMLDPPPRPHRSAVDA